MIVSDTEEYSLIKVRKINFNYLYSKYGLNPKTLTVQQHIKIIIYNPYLYTKLGAYGAYYKQFLPTGWYQVQYEHNHRVAAFKDDQEGILWRFLEGSANLESDLFAE